MSFVSRSFLAAFVTALLVAAAPVDTRAQVQAKPGAATDAAPPVVVVIQAAVLPAPGGRAVIVRRQTGSPREVIVLPAGTATAADLAAAMTVLARAREGDGGRPSAAQQRISISRAQFDPNQSAGVTNFYENVLARLSRSQALEIPGIAAGPAVILPQQRTTVN